MALIGGPTEQPFPVHQTRCFYNISAQQGVLCLWSTSGCWHCSSDTFVWCCLKRDLEEVVALLGLLQSVNERKKTKEALVWSRFDRSGQTGFEEPNPWLGSTNMSKTPFRGKNKKRWLVYLAKDPGICHTFFSVCQCGAELVHQEGFRLRVCLISAF